MSEDLARKKRQQAALSLTGASLGLAALGSKAGATATRSALKRAPSVANRLRLSPKGASRADKASLGFVTTASGVGGASGIHFAGLQREEAKKEDKVKKSDSNRLVFKAKTFDPEARREKRLRAYETGAAVGAGAAGAGALGVAAAPKASSVGAKVAGKTAAKSSKLALKVSGKSKKASSKLASTAMRANTAGKKMKAASKSPVKLKPVAALAGAGVGLAAASRGIKRHQQKSGRTYNDWWEG